MTKQQNCKQIRDLLDSCQKENNKHNIEIQELTTKLQQSEKRAAGKLSLGAGITLLAPSIYSEIFSANTVPRLLGLVALVAAALGLILRHGWTYFDSRSLRFNNRYKMAVAIIVGCLFIFGAAYYVKNKNSEFIAEQLTGVKEKISASVIPPPSGNPQNAFFPVHNANLRTLTDTGVGCYLNKLVRIDGDPATISPDIQLTGSWNVPKIGPNDTETAQCANLVTYPTGYLGCADFTVVLHYRVPEFTDKQQDAPFRFVVAKINDSYQWVPQPVKSENSYCDMYVKKT